MLKVIGVSLILAGSSGYGMRLYLDLKEGIWHIRWWVLMIERLISMINHQNRSLPECVRLEMERHEMPYKSIFLEVYQLYEEGGRSDMISCYRSKLAKEVGGLPLRKIEKDIVVNLLEDFPMYDREMQIKLLQHKKLQLEKCLLEREKELAEKKKLYTTLGVMVGLLLILILV